MRLGFLGDSYDVVKRFLLGTLAPGGEWIALPMFTEEVSPGEVDAFEAFLGVRVLSPGALTNSSDRATHLAVRQEHRYVFVDPDTGIKVKPCAGARAPAYVFGPELVALCTSSPLRLVVVFDQSVPRGGEREAIRDKLRYFRAQGVYGFAYLSHACFVALSATEDVCMQAKERLLATHLPDSRILTLATPVMELAIPR